MKNIANRSVWLFVISLLTFRYFSTIVSLFGAGARFLRLQLRLRLRASRFGGSGSGSDQNVSALAAPAPHPWIGMFVGHEPYRLRVGNPQYTQPEWSRRSRRAAACTQAYGSSWCRLAVSFLNPHTHKSWVDPTHVGRCGLHKLAADSRG